MSVRFIESYVHGNRIGVLVEFETTDDFVTRTDEFQTLARDIAMQIAASDPAAVDGSELQNVVSMVDKISLSDETDRVLMSQDFIKDPRITVGDRLADAVTRLGSKIVITRFVRFNADDT